MAFPLRRLPGGRQSQESECGAEQREARLVQGGKAHVEHRDDSLPRASQWLFHTPFLTLHLTFLHPHISEGPDGSTAFFPSLSTRSLTLCHQPTGYKPEAPSA